MQTHELFLGCTNETPLTHKSLLLAEAKLVDDVLTGRSLKSGPAAADNLGSKQAEPGARHEGAQAEYDAQQQLVKSLATKLSSSTIFYCTSADLR